MAAETHINDAGTWRKAKEIHVNDAGTWRKLKEVWINDAGTWRKVFSGGAVIASIANGDLYTEEFSSPATTSMSCVGDGSQTEIAADVIANPGDWYSPITAGIGNSFYVRFTRISGTAWNIGGLTSGTWYLLSSTRTIGHSRNSPGTANSYAQQEISPDQSSVQGQNASPWHHLQAVYI